MLIKCAWCGKDEGVKEPLEDKGITHTICSKCARTYFPETLNWSLLHFGPSTRREIDESTQFPEWQKLRESLGGETLVKRYYSLKSYLEAYDSDRVSQVQVTNYVNALRRGGLIE